MLIRHYGALRLLHSDPELTASEALLMVVAPRAALRQASLAAAREALGIKPEPECYRCHREVDEDGFCSMCGEVSVNVA